MEITIQKKILWQQFGAAIDTLENAITSCPEEIWSDRSQMPEYWYVVYHTLFFIDYYLSEPSETFAPPEPFTLDELDPAGILPERVYTQDELRNYLEYCRRKSKELIETLTEEKVNEQRQFGSPGGSLMELLLYSMRHIQHHAAQLNLILRQKINFPSRWVSKAKAEYAGE